MSDTPRTDAQCYISELCNRGNEVVRSDFARQLERELNEAKLKAADRHEWQDVALKVEAERDQLLVEIGRLKEKLERGKL